MGMNFFVTFIGANNHEEEFKNIVRAMNSNSRNFGYGEAVEMEEVTNEGQKGYHVSNIGNDECFNLLFHKYFNLKDEGVVLKIAMC